MRKIISQDGSVSKKETRIDRHKEAASKEEPFPGFWHPTLKTGYTMMPHELISELHRLEEAELNVILYILRHTWGFGEFDQPKVITTEEFMDGRKRRNGERLDDGTWLSDRAVKDGLEKAIKHGYITCEVDDSDKGRIKKSYKLKIRDGN